MSEGILNVARVLERTRAEGPGLRFCIWVQGCLRDCPGCCNAAMQPLKPRLILPVEEVVSRIRTAAAEHHVEGVTFLGGEPMLQAKGLSVVARAARRAGLTVMVFTGYTLEECRASPLPGVAELLAETDVLVDGPYLADRPEPSRNWIGSSNQRFHYFTDAYGPEIENDPACRGIVEVRVEGDHLRLNGCPRTLESPRSQLKACSRSIFFRDGWKSGFEGAYMKCQDKQYRSEAYV